MKNRGLVTIFLLLQIITILFLLNKITKQINTKSIDIVNIKKEDIVLNANNPNTSCYEFVANKNIFPTEKWLTRNVSYSINSDGLNEIKDYTIQKQRNWRWI